MSSLMSSWTVIQLKYYLVYWQGELDECSENLMELGFEILNSDVAEFEILLNNSNLVVAVVDLFRRVDILFIFCVGVFTVLAKERAQTILTKLKILFSNTNLISEIMEGYEQKEALIANLVIENDPLDLAEITKLSCLFMMHGIQVFARDLDSIYQCYGYCELYEIMLHMDIVDQDAPLGLKTSLMSVLTYSMSYEMDVCLQKPDQFIYKASVDRLLPYFALPKFKECCLPVITSRQMARLRNLPAVPLLLELSRNAARKFIKKEFNVKTSRQFHTLLNTLPIAKCYKDIIALKTPLYNV